jgi:hypothetical protein
MECRICMEGTGILLQNTCLCKGTQGAIHEACLKRWIGSKQSTICDICRQTMQFPRNRYVLPNGCQYIFTLGFDWLLRVTILLAHRFQIALFFRGIHWILFPLYVWSYYPVLQAHASWRYFVYWLYPVYFHNGRFLYPLPMFVLLWLTMQSPQLLFFFNPYKEFWYFHTTFLEDMLIKSMGVE